MRDVEPQEDETPPPLAHLPCIQSPPNKDPLLLWLLTPDSLRRYSQIRLVKCDASHYGR